ncbi:MAG: hypothetical protein JXB47_12035 [Anaerolineae bacterium]|nr:hypothetical protein [Anaerolineae bacterium]
MTDSIGTKRPKPVDTVPAEVVRKEIDDELAALPSATRDAIEAAIDILGNELARREVLARRIDGKPSADLLTCAMGALAFIEGVLDEDVLHNDSLFNAESLREELAELPPPDPEEDDPWILKSG